MRGKMLEVTSPDNWFTELFTRYASDLWNKPNREKPSGFTRQIVHDVRGKTYRLYDAKQTGESFFKKTVRLLSYLEVASRIALIYMRKSASRRANVAL